MPENQFQEGSRSNHGEAEPSPPSSAHRTASDIMLFIQSPWQQAPPLTQQSPELCPLEINKAEQTLLSHTGTALARLRSGYCRSLNFYMNCIDDQIQDLCPKCNQGPHNTPHLFACPADPTDLSPSDLWIRPAAAAAFLKLPGMIEAPDPPDDWG